MATTFFTTVWRWTFCQSHRSSLCINWVALWCTLGWDLSRERKRGKEKNQIEINTELSKSLWDMSRAIGGGHAGCLQVPWRVHKIIKKWTLGKLKANLLESEEEKDVFRVILCLRFCFRCCHKTCWKGQLKEESVFCLTVQEPSPSWWGTWGSQS